MGPSILAILPCRRRDHWLLMSRHEFCLRVRIPQSRYYHDELAATGEKRGEFEGIRAYFGVRPGNSGGTKRLQEKMSWMLNDNRIGVGTFTSLDGTLPPTAITR